MENILSGWLAPGGIALGARDGNLQTSHGPAAVARAAVARRRESARFCPPYSIQEGAVELDRILETLPAALAGA